MNKVTLPRAVADAIENLRERGAQDKDILAYGIARYTIEDAGVIFHFAKDNFDDLISAIVNGYTVEQTPEEAVRKYYEKCEHWRRNSSGYQYHEYLAKTVAIKTTLKMLGIKIEGVND